MWDPKNGIETSDRSLTLYTYMEEKTNGIVKNIPFHGEV